MKWDIIDFAIFIGFLLVISVIVYVTDRVIKNKGHKRIIIAIVVILVLLLWMEMGVGIFGTPLAGD